MVKNNPSVSVCIPAYNEENCIATTIHAVKEQDFSGDLEILVCANGCTDKTEAIAKQLLGDEHVLTSDAARKPVAWNALQKRASHNLRLFLDGDVRPEENYLSTLVNTLQETDASAVSSYVIPHFSDNLSRIIGPIEGPVQHISGSGYLIDANKVEFVMGARGFSQMPENIISDDGWLSAVLGTNIRPSSAKLHYMAPSTKDYMLELQRRLRSKRQLLANHAMEPYRFSFAHDYARIKMTLDEKPFYQWPTVLSRGMLRKATACVASTFLNMRLSPIEDNSYWERTESTKVPIVLAKTTD